MKWNVTQPNGVAHYLLEYNKSLRRRGTSGALVSVFFCFFAGICRRWGKITPDVSFLTFVFVSFPSSTLSTFIKILSLCCFPSLSHLGLSVSQGRRKAEELNPLVDSVLTEVRCKDLFPQMIWVRLLEKSYTMLLKKMGFVTMFVIYVVCSCAA